MIGLLQRVTEARVVVAGETVGAIGRGLLVLIGVERNDGEAQAERLLQRLLAYRVFADAEDKMNLSVADLDGGVLVVSQFTLCGDTRRGRRPSFDAAAPPAEARMLYEDLVTRLRGRGLKVETGRFQAMMAVSLVNDGPVTFLIDSRKRL